MTQHNQRCLRLLALSPLAFALAVASAQAAQRVDLHATNIAQLNKQYAAATAKLGAPANPEARHAELLGLDANSGLNVLTQLNDKDGTQHFRYQQTFRGIPIYGESIVVSQNKDGSVRNLFGQRVNGLAGELGASLAPKLSSAQALTAAKTAALGSKQLSMQTANESSRHMIYVDPAGRPHNAYVVSFFADGSGNKPTRPYVILDANTGAVLKKWDGLTTSEIGTGPGGNQKTGQYEWGSGGIYGYLDVSQSGNTCTMSNSKIKTVNLNGYYNPPNGTGGTTTAYSYTCPRNTYKTINGGYSPLNDAHYFGNVITKMYPAYTGYDALSFQLVMRVHYGSNYENAFWNGSTMNFGDGKNTFYPLVSSDVAGHEVSHGFTEQHSGLCYEDGSACGGMNEAFSDMGGEATEYYWKGTNDFLVGQEIFKGSAGQALRYMCTPSQDGSSIENASQMYSTIDPHNSSGVYNKAFCTLAKKSGWNTPTAFKVFARANALYWTASSSFNQGACGVQTAAQDLGLNVADVTAAFSVVGVSCGSTPPGGGGGSNTVLTKGVPATGQSASTGNSLNYSLVVPAGATNLTFTMSGGSGDADLYTKFGSAPTDSSYDCRPYKSGNTESCTFASPQAGTYYVRIKAYSSFSGLSIVGDYSTGGGGGGSCGGTVLCSGTAVALPSVSSGSVSSTYTLAVPSGSHSVTIAISGGTGDADLYVRRNSAPTTSSYDCRPYKSGNAESCTFSSTSAGTYYINVRAYASFSGVSLKGTVN